MSNVASFLKDLKSRQDMNKRPQHDDDPADEEVHTSDSERDGTAEETDAADRNYLLQRRKERLRLPVETAVPAVKVLSSKGLSLAPGARKRAREVLSAASVPSCAATQLDVKAGTVRTELRASLLSDLKLRTEVRRREAPDVSGQVVFALEGTLDGLVEEPQEGKEVDDVASLIENFRRPAAAQEVSAPQQPATAAIAPTPVVTTDAMSSSTALPKPQQIATSEPTADSTAVAQQPQALPPKPSSMTSRLLQLAKAKKERRPGGEGGEENLLIE